jgi:hypothetical protein
MRRYPRLIHASALVALLSALATTGAAWHAADDDLACAPLFASSETGAAPASLAIARPQEHSQHCLLCHWSRWARSVQSTRTSSVSPCAGSGRLALAPVLSAAHIACVLTFGRAPPA